MKVLFVSNMYPNKKNPYFGIFVKEQKEALEKYEDCQIDTYVISGKKGYLKSIFEIPKIVKRGKYDVVHAHFGYSAFFTLLSRYAALKTVITFHGSDILMNHRWQDKLFKLFINKIIKKVSHCIVQNEEMKSFVKNNNTNVSVITCGVDTDIFKPISEISVIEPPVIVFPSKKENPVKNWPLFEATVKKVQQKTTVQVREIKNMNRDEVCRLFNEASCLFMTSHTEGSPQVVKEALACNCPVITVNVGDVISQLDGVKNCHVAKTRESDELSALLLDNLSSGKSRTNGSKVIAEKGFTQEKVANKISEIYKKVLSYV